MKAIKAYLKANRLTLVTVVVVFLVTAFSLSWQWFTNNTNYAAYLRYENTQALILFAFALIPFNFLRFGRGVFRRLHINNLWCAGAFLLLAALGVSFLPGSSVYARRALAFLLFVVILAATGAVRTTDNRWQLSAYLISLEGWLLGRSLLGGGNSFGVWCAVGVAASVLASAYARKDMNKRLQRRIFLYLICTAAVPLTYVALFEPEKARQTLALWQTGAAMPGVSFSWCAANPKTGLLLGAGSVVLHIAAAILLLLAAKKADEHCRHGVTFFVLADLAFLVLGLLSYLRAIPPVLLPDSRFGMFAVLLPCLLVNSLIYRSIRPFSLFSAGDFKTLFAPCGDPPEDDGDE